MNHVDPELLAAWTDNGLSKEESRAVDSHLADCSECRAMAAVFGRTLEDAGARGTVAAPSHSREGNTALRASVVKWILPFAAMIVIAASVSWKYWPRIEQTEQIASADAPV